ncbi:peptidoglycan-binding protein [Peribacillus butanolivorans]|uniref:peptidoglycan-binding protein n=1 Tax=Peribacillus butanolivorans TaxID=421767 RepID=UPI0036DEDC12
MTAKLQTLLTRSEKNMGSGIHPVVKESALEMIKCAYKEGIFVQISAGYRSMEEQAKLYGQGRLGYSYKGKNYSDLSKPKVTNAQPGQSYHNYGLAIDYIIVSDDGKNAIWTVDSKWKRVAARIVVDGFYGPNTKKALIKGFQRELNKQYSAKLKVDGKWGPNTKAASPIIREGANGNITYILQAVLYSEGYNPNGVDGIFGSGTKSAVKVFQKANGLPADGIAGENTFAKLFA